MRPIHGHIILVFLFLIFFGCAGSNPPTHYYTLNSIMTGGKIEQDATCPSLGVGPVKLPEYVNRPQIISRTSPDEIALSYFDLWAEPVIDSVPRIIALNLSGSLCTKDIVLHPWKISHTPDYRIEVEILRMDGTLDKNVTVEAWWSIAKGIDRTRVTTKRSVYTEPVAATGYEGLVQAHSRIFGLLSDEIADAVKKALQ